MLSWRLWQTLSEPPFRNPIFHRIRSEHHKRYRPKQQVVMPSYFHYIMLVFVVIGIIRVPEILVILIQLPALLIVFAIISPILFPIVVMFTGGYLISKIVSGINKEKRQYTYELLCASPQGTLHACLLFAMGIFYRGDWFNWQQTFVHLTFRVIQIILIVLGGLTLLTFISGDESTHFVSLRTLVNLVLLLGLYYSSLLQPFVLSLLIGVYGASLDLNQRDSNIVALLLYVVLQCVPYIVGLALFIVFNTIVFAPHPAVHIGIDCIVLGSIYFVREWSIVMMWGRLQHKLNASSDDRSLNRQLASLHIKFEGLLQ